MAGPSRQRSRRGRSGANHDDNAWCRSLAGLTQTATPVQVDSSQPPSRRGRRPADHVVRRYARPRDGLTPPPTVRPRPFAANEYDRGDVSFSRSSKNRLTRHDVARFQGDTLFERVARVVCVADVLPRKELYEDWEVARRVRRRFRGGRVVDVAGGHGLLANLMLLLDDTSGDAHVVDPSLPSVRRRVARRPDRGVASPRRSRALDRRAARVVRVDSRRCGGVKPCLRRAHRQGARVCCVGLGQGSRVALLPRSEIPVIRVPSRDGSTLSLAIDLRRAARLEQRGYRVWTQTIPSAITPKNRLLLGAPIS